MKLKSKYAFVSVLFLVAAFVAPPLPCLAQTPESDVERGSLNKADRLEWFRDQGFGLFIHWSVDSQTGVVISHSLVGASPEYTQRFFNDLPKTFSAKQFDATELARLAHVAGFRYMVFTTKHHSGFAMFDTKTTPFNSMNTPFHRDATAELFNAFRQEGIATGVYFSPDDFWWLHEHGIPIRRQVPEVQPLANPGLLKYDQQQVTELMTHYGPVQVVFFDGDATGLRDLAWKFQPDTVVTRGALQTPELYIPGMPLPGAWEANMTMGIGWQYQPQNENYKSGHDLIRILVQTRAKGGNLLLNVGPKPNGELPIEQEERLREIGLWMMANSECIYSVRPWVVTNEQNIWFTRKKNTNTLYAVIDLAKPWERATWKDFTLHSVKATAKTVVSVLGTDGKTVEYHPEIDPTATWKQEADGLHVRAMASQRLQDNFRWPNPVVLKIENVEPGLVPPQVQTLAATADATTHQITLQGDLENMGDAANLHVGFEYRSIQGEDSNSRTAAWTATPMQIMKTPGHFETTVKDLVPGQRYEFRALIQHPLLTFYGLEMPVSAR